jgi:hypothetical protein
MKCGGGRNANNAQVVRIYTAAAIKRGRALIIKLQWLRHSNGSAFVCFGNTLLSWSEREREIIEDGKGIFCCN